MIQSIESLQTAISNKEIALQVNVPDNTQVVAIDIKDTGVGMDDEQLKQLFILKQNKSTKGTAGEKGTGLGLNLVRELILINQGQLLADSQPNMGTTIRIILPSAA